MHGRVKSGWSRTRRDCPLIGWSLLVVLFWLSAAVWAQPAGPDSVPPQVVGASPADGMRQVAIDTAITLEFSEPLRAGVGSFELRDDNEQTIAGALHFSPDGQAITFTPQHRLHFGKNYHYRLQGVQDRSGEPLPDPGFEARFDTFTPSVISTLQPGDSNTTLESANSIAYDPITKTVLLANGKRINGYPHSTGLLLVDVSFPPYPVQLGTEQITAGLAYDVALVPDVQISPRPCTACQPSNPPIVDPLTGNLALVVSGSTEIFSNLRIYHLDPVANPPYMGAQLLTTPSGGSPLPPIPAASGIPVAVATSNVCHPAAPGDSCVAYVATTSLGIQAIDIPRAIPRQRTLTNGGREPLAPIRDTFEGNFRAVDFMAGRVLAIGNLSGAGGSGLTMLTPDLASYMELPLAGANRVTGVEGFSAALDSDGDGSLDAIATFQLALVGADPGVHVMACDNASLACPLLGTLSTAVQDNPVSVYEITVDRAAKLAYLSTHGSTLLIADLEGLFDSQGHFVQGTASCAGQPCLDRDGDHTDDRILGIINLAEPGAVVRKTALDPQRGLLYLANDEAGLAIVRVQPVQAFFNRDRAVLSAGRQFRSTDRVRVDEDVYLFDRDDNPFCLTIDSLAPPGTTLRYEIHEQPMVDPTQPGGAVPGSPILGSGPHDFAGELSAPSREICLTVNRAAFPTFFGSRVPIVITDRGGDLVQELSVTLKPARIDGPSLLTLTTQVDRINQELCPGSARFTFTLALAAQVTLEINGHVVDDFGDADGQPIGSPFADIPYPAGTHTVTLFADNLPPGENPYQLKAARIAGYPGETLEDSGTLVHETESHASLPIGHTMIKGVDLWDGHLTHSSQDVMIPGRGLSLDFTRTYSSSGDSSAGPLGAGWTHSYNVRLIKDRCGRFVVIGGEGSGNAFRYDGAQFHPQIGYHSTLVRDPNELSRFDFFTKAHIRYHFQYEPALPGEVYTLRFIEEPNGNRVTLSYDEPPPVGDHDPTTLDMVMDSSGRALVFTHAVTDVFLKKRMTRLQGLSPVAGDLLGLLIDYEYDDQGNLVRVTRRSPQPSAKRNDERVEEYRYTRDGALSERHNLLSYTDPNHQITRYLYYTEAEDIPGVVAFQVPKHEIIKTIRQPEGVVTAFTYHFGSTINTRTVSDPRPNIGPTVYTLDSYGTTRRVEAPPPQPGGTPKITTMEWCVEAPLPDLCGGIRDVLMVTRTDAEGRRTEYRYDARGNVVEETIQLTGNQAPVTLGDGVTSVNEVTTRYRYEPAFNQLIEKIDTEGNTTYYQIDADYDGKQSFCPDPGRNTGNLLGVENAEGHTVCRGYDERPSFRGDLLSVRDPRGFVTRYTRYDRYGNLEESVDPLGNVATYQYDERSRLIETHDTFTHHGRYAYDGLDRKIREERLDDRGEGGTDQVTTSRYTPNGEVQEATDGLGQTTEYRYDALNRRRLTIERGIPDPGTGADFIQTEYRYDEAGNLASEIDYRGVAKNHAYDDLNRRVKTVVAGPFSGPTTSDQTLAEYTYDLVGNLLTETDLHGHTTTYRYDGLYRRVETQLPYTHSFQDVPSQNAIIKTAYDRVGNKLGETDPNGRVTTYGYDTLYRLTRQTDADGNALAYAYDAADNKIREENLSTGLVTEWTQPGHDGLNRPRVRRQRVPPGGPELAPARYETLYNYEDDDNAVVVTNPRGFKTRTDQDGLDRVWQTVVDVGGLDLSTLYTYDGNGNVHTVEDPEGQDIDVTYRHDGLNRKILATFVATPDDGGQPVTERFSYDGNGNLIRYQDKRGIVFTTTYDNLNRVLGKRVSETLTNGGQELALARYAYDDANSAATETDANGNETVTYSDSLHRPVRIDDPDPTGVLIFAYDGVNKRREIDKKGYCTTYDYDAINRLVLTQEGFETACSGSAQSVLRVEYQDQDNRVEETDRRGIKTIRQLDALQRLVQLRRSGLDMAAHYGSDPVLLETHEYDGNGNKTAFVDGRENRTVYVYDGADRQRTATEGKGSHVEATTAYTYDKVGNLLTVTIKDGRPHAGAFDMEYVYDARYRKVAATNGNGETTAYGYDAHNNLIRTTEPAGAAFATLYRYDELNQLLAVDETPRRDDGTAAGVTRFFYDGNRNKIAQQDANGNLVTYRYDGLNRLTDMLQHTVAGALSDGTVRGSDPRGGLLDAGGEEASALHGRYEYDPNGNLQRIYHPRLDVAGQPQQEAMTYDYLDRLVMKQFSHHAEPQLDFQMQSISYVYDDNSNVTCIIERKQKGGSSGGVLELTLNTYDPLDRIQTRRHLDYDDAILPREPCLSDAGKLIQYDYDVQGNRLRVIDPDNKTTTYTHDARNRLETVTTEAGVTRYAWWEDSLLKRVEYPNGTLSDRSAPDAYDAADRVLHIVNRPAAPNEPVFSEYRYTYDANGNRLTQVETQRDLPHSPETTAYSYDHLNRLRSVAYGAGANGRLTYAYAPNGNRCAEVGADPADPTRAIDRHYTYDRLNRLHLVFNRANVTQSVAFDYDDNGNRIAKTVGTLSTLSAPQECIGNPAIDFSVSVRRTALEYGIRDELLRTNDVSGGFATFDYGHDRMRVKKITPSTGETRYQYDDQATLIEYDETGTTTVKYDYGHQLLSLIDAKTTPGVRAPQFYFYDGLGSTANLTKPNDALVSYQYDAWGSLRGTAGDSVNPKKYTGHDFDQETDLHYFGARYYDDEVGLFITQDPYLGEINTPPSLHRYLYAYGNPLRFVDLIGYQPTEANASEQAVQVGGEKYYYRRGKKGEIEITNVGFSSKKAAPINVNKEPDPGKRFNLDQWLEETKRDLARMNDLERETAGLAKTELAQIEKQRVSGLLGALENPRLRYAPGIAEINFLLGYGKGAAKSAIGNAKGVAESALTLNPALAPILVPKLIYSQIKQLNESAKKEGGLYWAISNMNPAYRAAVAAYEMMQAAEKGEFRTAGEHGFETVEYTAATLGVGRVSAAALVRIRSPLMSRVAARQTESLSQGSEYLDDAIRFPEKFSAAKSEPKLLGTARDNLLSTAEHPKLRNLIDQMYRRNARIGSGSTADAIRHELQTGELLSPKGHFLKGQEMRTALQRLRKSGDLNPGDKKIATYILRDLQNSLSGQ